MEPQVEPLKPIRISGALLLVVLAVPLVYACIVPVSDQVSRANPVAALAVVLLFGMPFVMPFAFVLGPFGALRFIGWFWEKAISPRTRVHLLLKVYVFSIYLILLLIDLAIFCWMSPAFLDFMNRRGRWIGDAFNVCFGG